MITFARTNLHESENATLETQMLSMNSDPNESIVSSCNDRPQGRSRHHRHSSRSKTTKKHRRHHTKKKHKHENQAKDVTIEILDDSDDDLRQPIHVASKPTKQKKSMTSTALTILTNNEESPLPPSVFDTSPSSDSSSKQKLPSITSSPTEDYSSNSAPTPVGFVFDDSEKSFTKNKLYDVTSPSQTSERSYHDTDILSPPPAPHGPEEDVSMATSLPENQRNYHSSEVQTGAAGQTMPVTRSLSRNSISYSSDSGRSAEQERTNTQYEIVADAVLVDDPEIYDAEFLCEREPSNESRTPNIDINLYTTSAGDSRDKSCDNKFCLPISILLAVIVSAAFITLGVVLGLRENNTAMTNIATSTDISELEMDDHSQTSNIFYNSTTNHYFVQHLNGTATDVVSISKHVKLLPNAASNIHAFVFVKTRDRPLLWL